MKAGYNIVNSISIGNTAIEVLNRQDSNDIINLGWMYLKTAYIYKSESTVGVWKLKQLKN